MTPDELARGDVPRGERMGCWSVAVAMVVAMLARVALRGRR